MQTQVSSQQPLANFNKFWDALKVISGSYWYPTDPKGRSFSEVIRSWGMLILLVLLIIGLVAANAANSFVNRYLVDVIIQDKDTSKFFTLVSLYGLGLLLITLFIAFSKFVKKRISS